MKTMKPRTLIMVLALVMVASVVPMGRGPQASGGEALYNGGFELGFAANPGCPGVVGLGWGCFTNGGAAQYGFYDDMWQPVVAAGQHSQLVEINTKEQGGDANRNAGIFQRAVVQPGVAYHFSMKGMIRAQEQDTSDPWRYRVYVGFDYSGGTDWQAVSDWREAPWDTYYGRTSPGAFSSYETSVTPTGSAMTVFVRTERKWGTWYEETDFNLDSISLAGPLVPTPYQQPAQPMIHSVRAATMLRQPILATVASRRACQQWLLAPPAHPGDSARQAAPASGGYYAPPAHPGDGSAPVDPGYGMTPSGHGVRWPEPADQRRLRERLCSQRCGLLLDRLQQRRSGQLWLLQ